jgi:hypothetical protein
MLLAAAVAAWTGGDELRSAPSSAPSQSQAAPEAVPQLRWRVGDHRHVERTASHAIQLASSVGASMGQVQAQLGRVTAIGHVRLDIMS